MKKFQLITLVFLIIAGKVLCQSIPFPVEKAAWKEEHFTFLGPITHHVALCGDTLIDGITYSRVYDLAFDTSGNLTGKSYLGGIRSEDDWVLFKPYFQFNEYILYDFSLQPGQVIDLYLAPYGNETVNKTVDSVKTEFIAGKMRKVIYFHPDPWDPGPEYWMEGIGSSYGLLGRASPTCCDIGFALLCFQHDDEYLNLSTATCTIPASATKCAVIADSREVNSHTAFMRATPNPFSGETTIELVWQQTDPASWVVKIYTSTGTLLCTVPGAGENKVQVRAADMPPGVYIAIAEEAMTGLRAGVLKLVVR